MKLEINVPVSGLDLANLLEGKEVQKHISSGKAPTKLGMSWNDRVSLILTADMTIKRLQFLDLVKDRAEDHVRDGAVGAGPQQADVPPRRRARAARVGAAGRPRRCPSGRSRRASI